MTDTVPMTYTTPVTDTAVETLILFNETRFNQFYTGTDTITTTPTHTPAPTTTALLCSFGGVLLALVGGWFGGELVERLGVGVTPGADLNAPSSLTHGSAFEADVRRQDLHPTR